MGRAVDTVHVGRYGPSGVRLADSLIPGMCTRCSFYIGGVVVAPVRYEGGVPSHSITIGVEPMMMELVHGGFNGSNGHNPAPHIVNPIQRTLATPAGSYPS